MEYANWDFNKAVNTFLGCKVKLDKNLTMLFI